MDNDDHAVDPPATIDAEPVGNGGIVAVAVLFIIVLLLLFFFRHQLGLSS